MSEGEDRILLEMRIVVGPDGRIRTEGATLQRDVHAGQIGEVVGRLAGWTEALAEQLREAVASQGRTAALLYYRGYCAGLEASRHGDRSSKTVVRRATGDADERTRRT